MIRGQPVFDSCGYLGAWFARKVEPTHAAGLISLMDSSGIERSVVGSLPAVMYRNAQMGNEDLAREIEGRRDRLVPFGVINPDYIGWERDLEWCLGSLGARGVRVYPQYHGYKLTDSCLAELCAAAAQSGLPVTVMQRQEDYRQRHPLVDARDLDLGEVAALVARHPATKFIVMEGGGYLGSVFVTEPSRIPSNVWIEISRCPLYLNEEVPALLKALGAGRLLFGTGAPLRMMRPPILVAEKLELGAAEMRAFLGGTLEGLLAPAAR